ncbi:hypothetical protein ACJMK2_025193 [Sinanodonta woodiana]|uniref:Uncharacterized protein n=1 Tax=Sinanodonta woodiana TaxID=1069815 RepID=A0ABD3XG92_SINWO
MQFTMGLRLKWTFVFLVCILLIKMSNSKDISTTIPEQGSQVCKVFLVSGIYGVIDEHLSASSEFNPQHAAKYGRINTTFVNGSHIGAWAAKEKKNNQFIEVQLNQLSLIQAIQTQGRNITGDNPANAQYVKSYRMYYHTNTMTWLSINNSTGNPKLFPGNNDQNSIKVNQLDCPIEAQYIRINPWEYEGHPSMRFDLTGCLLTEKSTTDCDFEDGLCGWNQETGYDLLYWTRQNYTRAEDSTIPVDEFCSDNCSLLALTTPSFSHSNGMFRSTNLIRFIQRSSTPRYLRVWSTVKNITSAYINVSVIGCSNQSAMVSSKVVNISEHRWTPVAVDVRHTDYQLSINGGWKAGDQGYLAIDHILLITGMCPDCDFENDLCNWKNTGTVNWNVTREGSRTFIATQVSLNRTGLARLVGPIMNTSESRLFKTCLRFSYSIKGAANNTLWVYVNINGLKSPLWNCTGSSLGWITQYINILNGSNFQIEFEGNVEYGAVNIDDILVFYTTCPELPITTTAHASSIWTVTPGSGDREQKSADMWIYLGIAAGIFTVLVALAIAVVCLIRRIRRKTASKMGLTPLHEGKKAIHLEECEYSKVNKRSGTTTADQTDIAFGQIYENQVKPEAYQMKSHSTSEVDQTYDHIHHNEKPSIPYDPTYDHATFGSRVCRQIPNIPSAVSNASLHHTEYGNGENDETYSNVPMCRK